MNQIRQLKSGNSKAQLVRAVLTYQRALAYYASDGNWTKSYEGKFTWNDSREPTEVAKIVLGLAKEVKSVREPDKNMTTPTQLELEVKICPTCNYQMKRLPLGNYICTKCGHLEKKEESNNG